MPVKKILLASDATVTAALQQIAKILTATEGKDTTEKRDEIFEILLNTGSLKDELHTFSQRKFLTSEIILHQWIRTRSVIDVIDLKHGQADWCFVLRINRIPAKIYATTTPGKALQVVATSTQSKLGQKTIYAYGDSRMSTSLQSAEPESLNVAFFMAYKAGVVPQGM